MKRLRYAVWMVVLGLWFVGTANALVSSNNLSLDLNRVDLHDALQIIANFMRLNFIITPNVKGNISVHLTQLSPNEMLNTLLDSQNLTKSQFGKTWIIDSRNAFIQKQQETLKMQAIVDATDPLKTHIWQIRYAKAADISQLLQSGNNTLLSKRGHVRVDLRTNQLCVQDTEKHLRDIYPIITHVDIPVQQVLIKTRLASIDTDFEKQLGIQFDLLSSNQQGIYSLAIAKLADGSLLDLKLSALENEGHGELISSPRLFTANQQTASIESGEEIPYQEVSRSGATGVAFKKAVLSLKVTPQIMPGHYVLLQLQVNQDKPSNRIVKGVPSINTRQIVTNVLVKNGQTIALGGIYETNKQEGYTRIPFLSKIPLLGIIFQQKNQSEAKRELLIFVTPRIVGI
jgi:type IV pilus assembly protein PilQ